ncbi:MAG: hypothetical protein QOE61_6631, partial [Micromonosporaceae bacterium]|nr:hypothetical protein [Micromonosporaceae bacterium]
LGTYLLDGLREAAAQNVDSSFWKFRTFQAPRGDVQLAFGVCSSLTDLHRQAFQSWFLLRHHERGDDLTEATSIGILLTPRTSGRREWDTTMLAITGNPDLADEDPEIYRDLWNRAPSE